MAHEFESGFSVAQQMWHRHPNAVVLPDAPKLEDALRIAQLDWEVRTEPIFALVDDEYVPVPDRVATIRDSDKLVLGDVSKHYKVSQNKANLEGFRDLIDDGTLKLETAGSLKQGRRCWILGRYGDDQEVKNGDAVTPYILIAWGHDGKMGVRIINTPIRVVCMNTMQASGAKSGDINESFKDSNNITIAHFGDVDKKVKAAIRSVVVARAEFKNTMEVYRAMAGKPVDVQTVRDFAREIFDADYMKAKDLVKVLRKREETEDIVRRHEFQEKIRELEEFVQNREDSPNYTERAIVQSFEEGPGSDLAGSTVWGLANACTDYIDHKRRGSDEAKMASSWFGQGAHDRNKVFAQAEQLL